MMQCASGRLFYSQRLHSSRLPFRDPQHQFSAHKSLSVQFLKPIYCITQQQTLFSEAFLKKAEVIQRQRINKFINELDEDQKKPVKAGMGAIVVTAGPGSGKTRVLVGRIAYLIENLNAQMGKILALTFSKKAAREMQQRLADNVLIGSAKKLYVGTFHSICFRIIRDYYWKYPHWKNNNGINNYLTSNLISNNSQTMEQPIQTNFTINKDINNNSNNNNSNGFKGNINQEPLASFKPPNVNHHNGKKRKQNSRIPTTIDSDDQERIARKIFKNMGLKEGWKAAIEQYSYIRNTSSSIQEINSQLEEKKKKDIDFVEFVVQYELHKQRCHEIDFDDMLLLTIQILESDKQFLKEIQYKFDHVLVDEFQDTNLPQFRILQLITQNFKNNQKKSVFVVGDANQCIYEFRGSLVYVFDMFQNIFPQSQSYFLLRNYRSNNNIVQLSMSLNRISRNQIPGKVVQQSLKPTCKKHGDSVVMLQGSTVYDEATLIASQVQSYIQKGIKPCRIAVFYRSHFYGNRLAAKLRSLKIRLIQQGGFDFWNRKEVKILRYIFQLLINYRCSALDQLYKIIGTGIGEISYDRLGKDGKRPNETLLQDVVGFEFETDEILRDFKEIMEFNSTKGKGYKEKLLALQQCREMWLALEEKAIRQLPEFQLPEGMRKSTKIKKGIHKIRAFYVILRNVLEQLEIEQYKDAMLLVYCCLFEKRETLSDVVNVADAINLGLSTIKNIQQQPSFNEVELDMAQILELMDQTFEQEQEAVKDPDNCIRLMTFHASKGLEFYVSFITGLIEGVFPCKEEEEEEEEFLQELRLLYVALTRAEQYVVFSTVIDRGFSKNGNGELPSIFYPPYL
eukprot:TRINITY_DN2859_c1_g2_i4.p1 TRINITY_DN2859_c1_g2~~TRINITY_DN2859_c1_g2_i4.p1  ORF type:complete len:849 (+),score=95.58 TRINITY_DN2859_c1_g2_i4:28-2574(+)